MGFAAFLLGISLLLEGGLYFGTKLTSSGSRRWISDSFASDWRDTTEFQSFVSLRLERLIMMGAGGWDYGIYYDSSDAGSSPAPSTGAERWAKGIHEKMKEDKNLLYTVAREGNLLYSNSDALNAATTAAQLPQGYGFLLQFDGEKVRAWKDGTELALYDDDYYRFEGIDEPYQWYVPGYKNFTVDEAGSKVKVTMAVIDEPQIFIQGSYGSSGSNEYNELYYMERNLKTYRTNIVGHAVRIGVGLTLTAVYVLLRKDKKRADMALARCTGKVWFEVKILAVAVLVFFCMPRTQYLGEIWSELTYAYTPSSYGTAASADTPFAGTASSVDVALSGLSWEEFDQLPGEERDAVLQEYGYAQGYSIKRTAGIGTAVTILTENGGWLFQEYLRELADHTLNLLVVFWGLYLLVFNDWRYNRHPWKQGVFAILYAAELKYPLQKRLRRQTRGLALAFFLMICVSAYFFFVIVDNHHSLPLWWLALAETPIALACVVMVWTLLRQRKLWTDLGAVADQAAAVRAGELNRELALQKNSDLAGLADDLNHIRQGLHQAVEERTQSERMKVELVTNMSHDLKTPLTAIITYINLLKEKDITPEQREEYLNTLERKSLRLKSLIEDLFEFSKASSQNITLNIMDLDIMNLLKQVAFEMSDKLGEAGLDVRMNLTEEKVILPLDSQKTYRIYENLFGNIAKYALPGTRVYVDLRRSGSWAVLSVKNISRDALDMPAERLMERFVRGDASRHTEGSGLGLNIARSFMDLMGGGFELYVDGDLFKAELTLRA